MIDSHCHLDFAEYAGDRAEMMARARSAGVSAFVCIGSGKDTVSARQAVALAAYERFVGLARAVGRPVISHVRDAHDDAVAILTGAGAAEVGGVIHCFTGGV